LIPSTFCHCSVVVKVKKPNSSVPGVVDEDVRDADGLDPRLGGLKVGHVELQPVAGDLAGDPLGALDVDVADPDLGALRGEPRGDRRADAAGATGDERFSSLQPHGPVSIDWRGP
jgi:hypothetical protein